MADPVGSFVEYYGKIHGPLVVGLCVFGIGANLVNIIVLTRRRMIGPTNILLTGLSSAQLLLLVNYLIYTIYVIHDSFCNQYTKTYGWLAYLLLNVNLNLVLHTICLVHTTMLAIFRYAAVAFPTRCKKLLSIRSAKSAVMAAYISVPIVCSTFYPNSIVVQINKNNGNYNSCMEWSEDTPLYTLRYSGREWLRDYNFWFFSTVCKLLPCFLLVILSGFLIWELRNVRRRRERLVKQKLRKASKSERHHRQITIMLICVVLLFVAVELPQGVMNMLSAILKQQFIRVYTDLGDFFEMLTVLYSSINFILYCSMSTQFRATFKRFLFAPCLRQLGFYDLALSMTSTTTSTRRKRSSGPTFATSYGVNTGEWTPTTTALLDTPM